MVKCLKCGALCEPEDNFCQACGEKISRGSKKITESSERIQNKTHEKASTWLIIGSCVMMGLGALSSIINKYPGWITYLIGGVIAVFCGIKCSKWAADIDKSPNWAYVIGFFFTLFGLLGYWIYYKNKISKE